MQHFANTPGYIGNGVLATTWILTFIATIVVLVRLHVCIRILRKVSIDDYIILITMLIGIGNSVCITMSYSWGLGTHIEYLQLPEITYTVKWVFICEVFGIMCPGFGRISYAFMLLRLLPPSKVRRNLLWVIIGIQYVVDVATICVNFAQCKPISGYWDKTVEANCWPATVQTSVGFFQGAVSSAVDLFLALFPISIFWGLNMERKQKLSIMAIMGSSIFAMVASIVKTVKIQAIGATGDLTHSLAQLAIAWTLEANVVLLVVSIPKLRRAAIKRSGSIRAIRSKPTEVTKGSINQSRNRTALRGVGNDLDTFEQSLGFVVLNEITRSDSNQFVQPDSFKGVTPSESSTKVDEEKKGGIRKAVSVSVSYGDSAGLPFANSDNQI
ncbi:integral membrane protein [Xylariaceae sp. FL0804]|nr:integral membrane protein [Xylariaceae sp. FL0804]